MTSSLSSQRFCLRWNNHQSNLLSVFDQLLHDESFVDVTLAVEGRFLRAHKMVLSACSPYFQALFIGHPDKHPIVILKDVPYSDMRSLLDFMYRGEVSVDQDRLTAFLKVAESLRIKGLTEVNEEKCDLPSITSSLLSGAGPNMSSHTPPPPHLHRIHPVNLLQKRMTLHGGPLLGSALTAPKRKRGRPRKLSGSSNVGSEGKDGDDRLGETTTAEEMCEQKMTESAVQKPEENAIVENNGTGVNDQGTIKENHTPAKRMKEDPEPTPGTSSSSQDLATPFTNSRSDHNAFPIVKTEADEFDSESLPEDENDLITLSPSSSQSSLNPRGEEEEDCLKTLSKDFEMSRLRDELETFNRDQKSEDATRPFSSFDNSDCAELLESFPYDGFGDDGVTDDKSVRQFCVREANNLYRCVLCSKTYTHISNFCRHYMTTHTGKKQVVPCPLCNKPFTRRDNMLVHIKTVHRYEMHANKPAE